MHKIGLVVTSYNHKEFIGQTIQSVMRQTIPFDQVIVIDDGSSPECAEYVHRLCIENKIECRLERNRGVAAARNLGLSHLAVDYVVFLDDDDMISTQFVHRVKSIFATTSVDCICFNSTNSLVDLDEGHLTPSRWMPTNAFSFELPSYCPATSPGACAYSTAVLQRLGSFDVNIWGADDFDLLVRVASNGSVNVYSDVLHYHRIHENNASKKSQRMSDNIGLAICKSYRNAPFDLMIRLTYWYGEYGPLVFLRSVLKLLGRFHCWTVVARLALAYAAGRTFRRIV